MTKEVPGLRIIEDDLWERVQAIKQRYSSRWGNKRQTQKRLLSGLLKCGRCGGGMTISRGDRYYCSARREKSTCDADRGIGAHELEERVLNGLRDILLGNEVLIDEFAAEFKRELTRLRKQGHGARRRLLKESRSGPGGNRSAGRRPDRSPYLAAHAAFRSSTPAKAVSRRDHITGVWESPSAPSRASLIAFMR